jgi:hypothetical protein
VEKKIAPYSERCKSCSQIGKLHWNFIDGGISKHYSFAFYKIRPKIKKRDDYKCNRCKLEEKYIHYLWGVGLHVHHIDYDKQNNKESNLVSLCTCCHTKTNTNRKYWKSYFKGLIS